MKNKINIFTDGGARGNPGPSAIGVHIEDKEGGKISEISKTIGSGTNNTAEYMAVIEGLSWTLKNIHSLKISEVSFFMDSQLVCSQLTGVFKVKNSNIRSYIFKIRELEAEIKIPIFYNHIPREKNKKADALVNKALDTGL